MKMLITNELFLCVCQTERDQEAEEISMIYKDLQEAQETIDDLKQEKGNDKGC